MNIICKSVYFFRLLNFLNSREFKNNEEPENSFTDNILKLYTVKIWGLVDFEFNILNTKNLILILYFNLYYLYNCRLY